MVDRVVGDLADPAIRERVHRLEHHGRVDVVFLPTSEMSRRRLRVSLEAGGDLAIGLPRSETLFDGAVLVLSEERAVVVRAEAQRWLKLEPQSIAEAVELGYHVGNLHWRVRFEGEQMLVALEGPVEVYLERLDNIFTGRPVRSSLVEGAGAA